jgi:hypothetical protein
MLRITPVGMTIVRLPRPKGLAMTGGRGESIDYCLLIIDVESQGISILDFKFYNVYSIFSGVVKEEMNHF